MTSPFSEITARFTPDQESFAVVETDALSKLAPAERLKLVINRYGAIKVHFATYADWPENVVTKGQITAFDVRTSAKVDAPTTRFLIPTLALDIARQLSDAALQEVPA